MSLVRELVKRHRNSFVENKIKKLKDVTQELELSWKCLT